MQKQTVAVIILVVAIAAMFEVQAAQAVSFTTHNYGIPILGVRVKYQFFNETTHYRAFFNRYLLPIAGNVITLYPPIGKFSQGDDIHSCITEIYNDPQAQCTDTLTIDGENVDFQYDVHFEPGRGL